jgi:uncharacterized iron-regulated membrane protein
MASLADGVSTLAAASHDVTPPAELRRRVLAVLDEEWEPERVSPRKRVAPRVWHATAALALGLVLAWGAIATITAFGLREEAGRYRAFLDALGGEDVRAAEFRAVGPKELDGDVVVYESEHGMSWVLVLVRAPGRQEDAFVTMTAGERRIDLHPMEFGPSGDGSTWLVTSSDLSAFDTVNLWDEGGLMASAEIDRS